MENDKKFKFFEDFESYKIRKNLEKNRSASVNNDFAGLEVFKPQGDEIEALKRNYPNAREEEINKQIKLVVAQKLLIYVHTNAFEQSNRNKYNAEEMQIRKSKIKSDIELGNTPDADFFRSYDGDDFFDRLRKYKNEFVGNNNYTRLTEAINSSFGRINKAKKEQNYEEKYEAAMLAPNTDGKGVYMPRNNYGEGVVDKSLNEWQRQADQIKIGVSEGISAGIVKFAVMGNVLKRESLEKAYNILDEKDRSPASVSVEDDMQALFFDSLLANNQRPNIQAIRGVVPDCRQNVKDKIASNGADGIKDDLKNAFDVLYKQINSSSYSMNSSVWQYQLKKINELLTETKKNNIEIDIKKEQIERVEAFNKINDSKTREKELKNELCAISNKFLQSEGNDIDFDPLSNPDITNKLVEYETLKLINAQIDSERLATDDCGPALCNAEKRSGFIAAKELTPTAELFVKHSEQLIESTRARVINSREFKAFLVAGTVEEKKSYLGANNGEPGFNLQNDEKKISYIDRFENKYAADALNDLHGNIREEIADIENDSKMHFDGKRLTQEEKEKRTALLNTAAKQIEKIQNLRKKSAESSIINDFDELAPEYKKLGEAMEKYYDSGSTSLTDEKGTVTENKNEIVGGEFWRKTQSMAHFCNEYGENLGVWRKGQSISNKQREHVFGIINRDKTLLQQSFNELKSDFDYIVGKKGYTGAQTQFVTALQQTKALLDNAEKRENTAELKEKYNECIRAAEGLTTQRNSPRMQFFAKNALKTLETDNAIIQRIKDDTSKSFSERLNEARELKEGRLDELKSNALDAADRLELASERTGGNSKEFEKMLACARSVRESAGKNEDFARAMTELGKAAQQYINEKKTVPSTEKGKERLALAKEMRDLAVANNHALEKEAQKAMLPNTNDFILKHDTKYTLYLRSKNCADVIKRAKQADNNVLAVSKVSELLFTQKLIQKYDDENPQGTLNMLKVSSINRAVQKLNPVVNEFLKGKTKEEIGKLLTNPNDGKKLTLDFERFVKARQLEQRRGMLKAQASSTAERSDAFIGEKTNEPERNTKAENIGRENGEFDVELENEGMGRQNTERVGYADDPFKATF